MNAKYSQFVKTSVTDTEIEVEVVLAGEQDNEAFKVSIQPSVDGVVLHFSRVGHLGNFELVPQTVENRFCLKLKRK